MIRYANQTPKNADKMKYHDLFESVKKMLRKAYNISDNKLTIIADLMCRNDEDVIEIGDQFYPESEAPNGRE